MGSIKEKSRTLRRVKVKTPTRLTQHYRKRHSKSGTCVISGIKLPGVARCDSRLSKTSKRPQRPYGGVLSSSAMRELIIRKARESGNQ